MMTLAKRLLVLSAILASACSSPSLSTQVPPCEIANQSESIAELRRTVEAGPLYTIPAAGGVANCRGNVDEGVISLEYNFQGGGWLRVKRDPSIEYNDQEARFGSPLTEDPNAVLKRAELAAFGADGCGINWEEPEKGPEETIFRGDTCNCQARIRHNAAGQAIGLTLRSTC
jgi:hypothetical protein